MKPYMVSSKLQEHDMNVSLFISIIKDMQENVLNKTLFINKFDIYIILAQIYVDDIIIGEASQKKLLVISLILCNLSLK